MPPTRWCVRPFAGNLIPASRLNAGWLAFMRDTVPAPISTGVANFNQLDLTPTDASQHEYSARVDHTFSSRDFAWARVSGQHYDLEGSGGRQGLTSSTIYTPLNIGASWVHTFSPTSVLQVQFGRAFDQKQSSTRFAAGTAKINQDTGFNTDFCCVYRSGLSFVPNVAVAQFFSGGESAETATYGNVWQYKANHSLIRGSHEIKFGGEWDNIGFQDVLNDLNVGFDTPQNGRSAEPGQDGQSAGQHAARRAASAGGGAISSRPRGPGGILGFYVQDSWKATRRLTVNFGVRDDNTFIPPLGNTKQRSIYMGDINLLNGTYLLQAQPGSCATLGSAPCIPTPDGSLPAHVVLSPNQKILNNWLNNWQPRVGLAYRASDKRGLQRLGPSHRSTSSMLMPLRWRSRRPGRGRSCRG